ncbi:MAG: hypothetical protein HQL06_15935 [Nitrospirae bacterium]|nr:hypothetical protein [Nitrospirota bacterium]
MDKVEQQKAEFVLSLAKEILLSDKLKTSTVKSCCDDFKQIVEQVSNLYDLKKQKD